MAFCGDPTIALVCVVLDKSSHALQVVLYFSSDDVPCHAHTSTNVHSVLAPDDSRQMQILDRTGMLRALDFTADGLIKLYALVETGVK